MSAYEEFFEFLYPTQFMASALPQPAASAMAALLKSDAYAGANLIDCRAGNDQLPESCMLVIDVEVALGQRPVVNDIRQLERVGIIYAARDVLPAAFPFRDDFPMDVPHLNLAARDEPRSLCLFEMPAEEALRVATPLVLVERVRYWLKETAYGRLHGDDQPLDPIFQTGCQPVVLPPTAAIPGQADLFYGWRSSACDGSPIFLEPATLADSRKAARVGLSAIVVNTKPLPHARLRMVPLNVAELLEAFAFMGADLLSDLQGALRTWTTKPRLKDLIKQHCVIVVRTPIERSPGKIDGEAAKAFLTVCRAEELAEKLGAFWIGDQFGGRLIAPPPLDLGALEQLKLLPMDVYRPFDREVAQAASGAVGVSDACLSILLAGAGALGSQVALTAAKMGLGTWIVVDPDFLFPHNMARHGVSPLYLGKPKAEAVSLEIKALLGDGAANSIVGMVDDVDKTGEALSRAALVIDASASVPISRWLATASSHPGRTASVFLNPTGTDLVILVEGEGRMPRLDHVEMSYYWALANGEGPDEHLSSGKVGLFPSGGCRTPSLSISQADIGALAPLAARRLFQYPLPPEGVIEIKRVTGLGVNGFSCAAVEFTDALLGDWTISISADLLHCIASDRRSAGAFETGGIVVGTWDRVRKRVYVVGHYDPPPDSVSERTGFVRGSAGVYQTLDTVRRRTAGNLTYIGEWHTHPPGLRSNPSAEDQVLLKWIGDVLVFSDVPALMLIAGDDGIRAVLGPRGVSVVLARDN